MRGEAGLIVGKRIIGVVMKESRNGMSPNGQMFLVFDDNTSFEFYTDTQITPAGGLDRMSFEDACNYMDERSRVLYRACEDPETGEVVYG